MGIIEIILVIGAILLSNGAVMEPEIVEMQEIVTQQEIDKFTIPRNSEWLCFQYSMAFQDKNPEWGVMVITQHDNPRFQGNDIGDNHIINYIINDDKSIMIHDEMECAEYTQHGWIYESNNWHFFMGEPHERWEELRDNKEMMWDALA